MARYECKTVSLSSMVITPYGPVQSLCTRCSSLDCQNRVQWRNFYIFGKPSRMKVLQRGSAAFAVIECQGFGLSLDRDLEQENQPDGQK